MSSFNANSQIFNVGTENELAEVLSHYNSDYVYSVLDTLMKKRFVEVPLIPMPNIVAAWESNFKSIMATYGSDHQEIMRVRNETYKEIIDMICKEFGINFTIDDTIDIYSAAYHIFNLMVANFADNMATFFANFIYKERSSLYESLNLGDLKKNKDSSTLYGKKLFKDIKLVVLNANIDMVVKEISAMDIPFYNIISNIYGANSELTKYFVTIISAGNEFFQKSYLPVLESDIRPEIMTSIRFKLQAIASSHDQITKDIPIVSNED